MAQILDAKLDIQQDKKHRTSTITTSCRIVYADNEFCLMKTCGKGVWYTLFVALFRLTFDQQVEGPMIPGSVYFQRLDLPLTDPASQTEVISFSPVTVASALLNINWGPPPFGQDNIVAHFNLQYNLSVTTVARASSNIVSDYFLP